MCTASSQTRTCCEFASASEYTATVRTPRRFAVSATRQAISPRFAIRIFLNTLSSRGLIVVRFAHAAIWLRHHVGPADMSLHRNGLSAVVATVRNQDLLEHQLFLRRARESHRNVGARPTT